MGISGVLAGERVFVGNGEYMESRGFQVSAYRCYMDALSNEGKTVLLAAGGERLLGLLPDQ